MKASTSKQEIAATTPPVRVQRKRIRGWRMPPNTVSVTRPGKFGNPFSIEKFRYRTVEIDPDYSTACAKVRLSDEECRREAVWAYESWLDLHPELVQEAREELRGKNLACFCPLDQPCHADVLLARVNEPFPGNADSTCHPDREGLIGQAMPKANKS